MYYVLHNAWPVRFPLTWKCHSLLLGNEKYNTSNPRTAGENQTNLGNHLHINSEILATSLPFFSFISGNLTHPASRSFIWESNVLQSRLILNRTLNLLLLSPPCCLNPKWFHQHSSWNFLGLATPALRILNAEFLNCMKKGVVMSNRSWHNQQQKYVEVWIKMSSIIYIHMNKDFYLYKASILR